MALNCKKIASLLMGRAPESHARTHMLNEPQFSLIVIKLIL